MYRKIKNGKTQKALIVLWVALLVGCVGYLAGFKNKKAASQELSPQEAAVDVQASYVRVEKAESDKVVRETIDQNMSIEAVNRVQVLPRVTGRLETLHVKAGDVVKKGQALAVLEHEQQDALIGSTQAQLASARADSERARVEMTNAKTNLDRYQRLLKEGFSTRQQYDSVETSYASAKASYNAAQAKEKQSAAELNRVKSTQQDYILYSPIDGTVLSDYSLTVGAMISPSSPIVDIADLRRLKATVRIPEIKIFAVKPGMDVIMKFDALKGREFRGKVTRVDPYVDPATRTSAVEMELDNEAVGNLPTGHVRQGVNNRERIQKRRPRPRKRYPKQLRRAIRLC